MGMSLWWHREDGFRGEGDFDDKKMEMRINAPLFMKLVKFMH